MPEWPEVEFCRRRLVSWILGDVIEDVWASAGPPLRGQTPEQLQTSLRGKRISEIHRKGKQLACKLSNGPILFVHLGMTGKWLKKERGEARHKHVRMSIVIAQKTYRLDFLDPRRFGRIRSVSAGLWEQAPEWVGLGPDAMELVQRPVDFCERVGVGQRTIKAVLLDQTVLSGVGNIYAAEALFLAGVDPRRAANDLSDRELCELALHLRGTMMASLGRERGEQIRYIQDRGTPNPFVIYGRAGEACVNCGESIQRMSQHGRSTFWCSACQS